MTQPLAPEDRSDALTATPLLRLSSPKELVESIPHLVGFTPCNSVVVTLFAERPESGALRTVGSLRVDLPTTSTDPETWASAVLAPVVRRSMASAAAISVWLGDDEASSVRDAAAVHRPTVVAIGDVLAAGDMRILDGLVVAGPRFVSLFCEDDACCGPQGQEWSPAGWSGVSAELAIAGCPAPAGSREELEALTEPTSEGRRAFVAARASLGDGECCFAMSEPVAMVDCAVKHAVSGVEDPTYEVDELMVLAAIGVSFGRGRDHAVRRLLAFDTAELNHVQKLWDRIVRSAPLSLQPAPAALSALTAYLCGNGALANIALERGNDAIEALKAEALANGYDDDLDDTTAPGLLLEGLETLISNALHPDEVRAFLSTLYAMPTASSE